MALLTNAELMRSLPAPVLSALEDEHLGGQVHEELAKLLIKKWNSLKEEAQTFRGWLSEQGIEGNPRATRKRVARSVLVRLDEPLSDADLALLLSEGDPESRIAALTRIKSTEPQQWARFYYDVKQTTAFAGGISLASTSYCVGRTRTNGGARRVERDDQTSPTSNDAGGILDIAMAGTSATLLARKWESALLVNVDNDTVRRILDDPAAMAAVERIEGWRSLGDNIIETIINKSEKVSGNSRTRRRVGI